jgi:hypothetical protein
MTTTSKDLAFDAMRKALAELVENQCEGFCKEYPTAEYFVEDDVFDCSACKSRSVLALADKAMEEKP